MALIEAVPVNPVDMFDRSVATWLAFALGGQTLLVTGGDEVSKRNPTITVTRVFERPNASKVRDFIDDVRDWKFLLPISRRMLLRDAGEAHGLAQGSDLRKNRTRVSVGRLLHLCED